MSEIMEFGQSGKQRKSISHCDLLHRKICVIVARVSHLPSELQSNFADLHIRALETVHPCPTPKHL